MLVFNSKVLQWFKEAVNLHATAPSELKRAVLAEPMPDKVKIFIDNISKQLQDADRINMRKGKYLKETTYQQTVYDMANLFIDCFEGAANKRKESDLARIARDAVKAVEQEYEDVLSGKASGEFAEAGVISDEKEDAKREKQLAIKDQAAQANA